MMIKRQGLFAAWIVMCGFTLAGCTVESSDDDDDASDDDAETESGGSASDDGDDSDAGGESGSGNAGQAGSVGVAGGENTPGGGGQSGAAQSGVAGQSGSTGEPEVGGTSGGGGQANGGGSGAAGATGGTAGGTAGGAGGASNGGSGVSAGAGGVNEAGAPGVVGGAGSPSAAQSNLAQIEGATFTEGGRPDTTGSQTAPAVGSPEFVINGGTGQYIVTLNDEAESIIVGIEGDNGYFTIPITSSTGTQTVDITLLQGYALDTLGVLVATVDGDGDVSAWTSDTVAVHETLTGDIKVSLSFDEAEDLDLHVTDPDGLEIFYGNKTGNGATLDLDSNPGCQIDGINNENITWDGDAALRGEYSVEVHYYEQCAAESVDYIVTVTIGDEVQTHSGSFLGSDGGSSTERRLVTTFTY